MFKFFKKLFKRISIWIEEDVETIKHLEILESVKEANRIENEKLDKIITRLNIKDEIPTDTEDMYEEAQKLFSRYNESSERMAFIKGVRWQINKNNNSGRD